MANMSYCRFENTSSDFADCIRALREEGITDLSRSERQAAEHMVEQARKFIALMEEAAYDEVDED